MLERDRSALDAQRHAFDQRAGDRVAGEVEDAAEGLARDAHALGGLAVVKPLEIGKAERFELVEGKREDVERGDGAAGGLEDGAARKAVDVAAAMGTWHGGALRIGYEHMPITRQGQGE